MVIRMHSVLALVSVVALLFLEPVFAATGRIPGHFAVSPVGSAQYSISIWSPTGPRGIQPNISLFYDHHSGIGPLGVGWSLGGLGSITRCNKSVAQDTTASNVALAVGDGYCINGNRLRLTSGTYGEDSSTYQTEIADFSNITAHGAAGNGPAYFTVQGRDGLSYQYGFTDANGNGVNSQVLATGTSTALTWMLSKVTDRAGNNYVINYMPLSGAAVPAKILWTPQSAGSASYTYSMVFNYTTNLPQSSVNKYVGGTLVSNTELLSSIVINNITSGTVVIRDYFLTYQASSSTGRNELTKVTECADSAESNCLLPTTVGYEAGTAGVSTTVTTALSSTGALLTARYDLNGDGYPDLVYDGGTTMYVAFGSSSGYGTPINTGIPAGVLIGRLMGGVQDDILGVNGGTWYSYVWNGASFTGTSTGIAYDTATYGYQLADINGDGLPDLVDLDVVYNSISKKSIATIYTRLNTGGGTTVSFSSTATTAYTLGGLASAQLETPDTQYGSLRRYDFNGDGLDDLVLMVVSGTTGNYVQNTYELLASGTTFTQALIASVSASTYTPVFFTNWNDDKCTDFVSSTTLYVSGCNGTVPETYAIGTVVAAMDWDGDGRTDLLVANGSTLGVYKSTGAAPSALITTTLPYTSTCQYVTMDVNGDGLDDLGCWSQSGSSPISYYLHNGSTDLATSFVDGYGNFVKPQYVSISQLSTSYNAWNDQVYPYQNWIGAYYVVEYATFSDPSSTAGATYYQQFWYAGASMNLEGRGFAGFGAKQRYDSRSGIWETWNYSRGFPNTGMLNFDVAAQDNLNAKPINWRTNNLTYLTLNSATNNERYFPYANTTTINGYEVGGAKNADLITSTVINYGTPDVYGNFGTVTSTVTDEDSQSPVSPNNGKTWTSTTVSTITADTSTWCLSLPTEVQVTNSSTATGGAAITQTVNFTPDYTNCRETQKVVAPGTSYQVTEVYGFDDFGNVATDTVTGSNMPSSPASRETQMNWGTTGQFPTVISNPLGQSVTLGHDPNTGKLTSQTDPNYTSTNPLTTTWLYDSFGRKTQETRTDGTYTTWTYNDCSSSGGCLFGSNALALAHYIYASNGTLLNDGTTYFDTVGRPVMANQMMLSGAYSRVDTRYDSLGRIAQQSMPCTYAAVATACTYWTTNSYDVLNRLTLSQRPISSTNSILEQTVYGYLGRTSTVKDPLANTSTKISLVTGGLARSQDPAGYYLNFTYDAFGALTAVKDSASNALFSASYAYGISAFKTASTDMDLGARSYTVDSLGEVTGWTDAKTQSFSMTYDALSRPLVRTDDVASPDLTTTWTWGSAAASYNISKLASVTAVGSAGTWSDTYTYDSLSRPSTEVISNPGDRTYTYVRTYDPHSGLLASLQYPVDISFILTLQYAYTNGILSSISSNSLSPTVTYWTANTTNPRGQVTQETLGNGVVINRNYDAVTGWLGSVQAGPGGGSSLQNNTYSYDEDGNVTERQDNNQFLTENFYYDALNRLSYSTLGGSTNLQMTYDTTGMGNIAARSDVAGGAAWTYDPVRKHAVTQAGSSANSYTYDANGNAITRNGSAISWSSYNYPTSVTTATESVDFYYGGDRQRWKEVYTNSNGTETTYRAGRLFEVAYYMDGGSVLAHYRHYVYAGNELVSIDDRSTAATPLYYVVSDHQGSYSNIETSAGTIANFVSESFTAFGNRRNGESWSGAPSTTDEANINIVSRRGFTDQSTLGISMGLNHLNGRVEDGTTGRFLSPDPTVSDPGDTQSFNRYSYVNNRPLTYVDPSGFTACPNNPGGRCGGTNNGNQNLRAPGAGLPFGGGSTFDSGGDDDSEDDPEGTAALTAWFNGASAYISDVFSNIPTGNDGSNGAPTAQSSVDESAGTAQSGCVGSPCLVDSSASSPDAAARFPPSQWPTITGPYDTTNASFACGSGTCAYEMNQYVTNTPGGSIYGEGFSFTSPNGGAGWVQTYTRSDNPGVSLPDGYNPANPWYPANFSNAHSFGDSPGVPSIPGYFVAQTSQVVANGSGGYSATLTVQWGMVYTASGSFVPIGPTIVTPSSAQLQAIGTLH